MDASTFDLTPVRPGMDVCDSSGEKIGTVTAVHSRAPAAVGGRVMDHPSFVEVKTGLLGLGAHLYAPAIAVQDATEACLFLRQTREEIEREHAGWRERPASLDEPG
jgi:hypothetical protein